jgi:DNA-binding response OmpR family regulator
MAEKILIVDDDIDTLRLVGLMLQRQGYQISAASNGEQGLVKALEERPDLILLDVMMPDMDGYEVTRRLRKNPATATTPILMFTAKTQLDDKVTGFEVGVDDYLTKPTHPAELQAHVKSLLARSDKKKDVNEIVTAHHEQHGFVVGVMAVRGGLGVSSLVANLATAIFTRAQTDVILAEMVPGHGTLGMDLGLPGQKALNDLLSGTTAEITREKVNASLVSHNSGLKLMMASENPRDIHLTSQVSNYGVLITRLASLARFVVLDLGASFLPFVQGILPMCNERIVVLEGSANTIEQSKLLINEIAALGIERKSITVVLNNRVRSESQMSVKQVQEKLEHSIAAALTPAPELFVQALRMHTTAVLCQPSNVTSQQYIKMADLILAHEKTR